MPIISKVEGQSFRGRVIYATLFLLLTLGGATMVYPFLLMFSGSLRSSIDENDMDVVPDYLVDTTALYCKFLETKYDAAVTLMGRSH